MAELTGDVRFRPAAKNETHTGGLAHRADRSDHDVGAQRSADHRRNGRLLRQSDVDA